MPLEDALTEDPIQVMFNGAVSAMRPLAELLRRTPAFAPRRRAKSLEYSVLMTEYVHRDFTLVDVTRPRRPKAARWPGAPSRWA